MLVALIAQRTSTVKFWVETVVVNDAVAPECTGEAVDGLEGQSLIANPVMP